MFSGLLSKRLDKKINGLEMLRLLIREYRAAVVLVLELLDGGYSFRISNSNAIFPSWFKYSKKTLSLSVSIKEETIDSLSFSINTSLKLFISLL
jgi:hypothetical protein